MFEIIVTVFALSIALNLSMFLIAYFLQTDKLTDLSYSLSFLGLVLYVFFMYSDRSLIDVLVSIAIILWALRLGSYLLYRINKMGHDARFDNIRENFLSFLGFWIMQGISVAILLLFYVQLICLTQNNIGIWNILFLILSVGALVFETIADAQKFKFKISNPGKQMRSGLWTKIRHPNYTGELLFWLFLCLSTLSCFDIQQGIIAMISPLWIAFIIIVFSGIPPLEKKWKEKYSGDKNYSDYLKNSWRLIPFIY